MKNKTIGILKHTKYDYAETLLAKKLRQRDYDVLLIDPRLQNFEDPSTFPNLIISRCELDSFTDPLFSAYLSYLHQCKIHHIPIINSQEFIVLGQDKYLSHLALHQKLQSLGIKDTLNPETTITYHQKKAKTVGRRFLRKYGSVVLKHPQSGRGVAVFLAREEKELDQILHSHFPIFAPVLIQQPLEKEKNQQGGYRDFRIWVYREADTGQLKVYGGYYRNAPEGQFLTNISQGSYVTPCRKLDKETSSAAQLVAEATQADVAGIDLVRDTSGHLWFEEINVAFETSSSTIELMGNGIWDKVVDLVETKI